MNDKLVQRGLLLIARVLLTLPAVQEAISLYGGVYAELAAWYREASEAWGQGNE